ncbi:MAG TPA: porin family protein [Bacteroidales bacterium]|nr:porin family protein [Bacteroidales bacterium]
MKNIILSLLALCFITALEAQEGIRPGVVAGFNLQNINGTNELDKKLQNDLLPGFHAGVNVLMPVAPEIYFQPGVLFSTKGTKLGNNEERKINYIEVPLNILYRGQLGNNYILVGFGPYAAFAAGGKYTVAGIDSKLRFTDKIALWDPRALRRFDAGANIFAGYELSAGLFFTLNAQLGLLKINPDLAIPDARSWKNTGFGLSAGYRF